MHYLSSVYFVNQPLHVSGIFVAHHQEVYCIYTTIGTCYAVQWTVCWPGFIEVHGQQYISICSCLNSCGGFFMSQPIE